MAKRPKKAVAKVENMVSPPPNDNVLGLVPNYVTRIEALEEEKKAISDDIKDIYTEAKDNGIQKKPLKMLITKRKKDASEQQELEALLAQYENAMLRAASRPAATVRHEFQGPGVDPDEEDEVEDEGEE